MESSGPPNDRGEAPGKRIDFTLEIQSVGELYSDVAPRLSGDGIFIEVDDPPPAETPVGFRVVLPDDVVLIQGQGTVIWSRVVGLNDGPPGMAVRFAEIDPDMKDTIDAVIDAHLGGGGALFDLDRETGSDTFPTDSLADQSSANEFVRWRRDDEPRHRHGSPGAIDEDTEVIDLKFEEAIAGFSEPAEPPDSPEDRALDDAISSAVSLPATAGVQPEVVEGSDQEPEIEIEESSENLIPEILEGWKDELEVASRRPEPRKPVAGVAPTDAPWESLLPFDSAEEDAKNAALFEEPRESTSSARRAGTEAPGPNRLWLALPVLAIVVVGVAITVWFGENRRESTSLEDPSASLNATVEVATEEDPAGLSSTGSDVEADSPTPVPKPTPAPVPKSTSPATRVTSIAWDTVDGETEVVIRGDGLLKRGRVDASRLG